MKVLFLTDLHGKNPLPFIKEQIEKEKIEKIVCLGDYDDPKILEDLIKLNFEKRLLIGNHDHDFVTGEPFYSPLIRNFLDSKKLWDNSTKAKKFVLECINLKDKGRKKGMKIVESLNGKKIVYVHGTLYAYCSDAFVWGRLDSNLSDEIIKYNFNEMKKKDYWILFRGHDHVCEVFSMPYDSSPFSSIIKTEPKDKPIHLKKDKRYIIGLDGFFKGAFGILDTEKLEFKCSITTQMH